MPRPQDAVKQESNGEGNGEESYHQHDHQRTAVVANGQSIASAQSLWDNPENITTSAIHIQPQLYRAWERRAQHTDMHKLNNSNFFYFSTIFQVLK